MRRFKQAIVRFTRFYLEFGLREIVFVTMPVTMCLVREKLPGTHLIRLNDNIHKDLHRVTFVTVV